MCGIVGFTGKHQAAPILLDGLSRLNIVAMIRQESPSGTRKKNRSHQSKRRLKDSGRKNGSWSVGSGEPAESGILVGQYGRALNCKCPSP